MALTGDLRNIGLSDLFQTLHQNRATGVLEVVSGSSRKSLLFTSAGVTLKSRRALSGARMGKRLIGLRKVTAEDIQDALAEQEEDGGLIGELLVSRGCCTEDDIQEVIRYHIEEDLFELFSWTQGTFSFHEGSEPSQEELSGPYAAVSIDPAQAIFDAARRIDECQRAWDQLPHRSQILTRTNSALDSLDQSEWNSNACEIYARLDDSRTIDEILDDLFIAEYEAIPTLVELQNHGLARKRTVSELASSASVLSVREEYSRALLCLKAALIDRPDDLELLDSLCAIYESMGDTSEAAGVLKHMAQLSYGARDFEAAADLLTRASRYSPGSADIHEQLAMVLSQGGDPAGAMAAYISASEIMIGQKDFRAAIDICTLGLQLDPNNIRLRYNLANSCIGAGDTQAAVEQLIELVPAVEAEGSRRRIEDIYRRILQLDSSRREYLARLERVTLEGIRKRKRIKVMAVLGSSILVLAALAVVAMPGGPDCNDLVEQANAMLDAGDLRGADRLANQVIDEDPESDAAILARNILEMAARRKQSASGPEKTAKLELDGTLKLLFDTAELRFADGIYDQGVGKLVEAVSFLQTEDTRRNLELIGKRDSKAILSAYRKQTTDMLATYVEGLKQLTHKAEGEFSELKDEKLATGEISEVEIALEKAERLLNETDPTMHERIVGQAEMAESAISNGKAEESKALQDVIDRLRRLNAEITGRYHTLRASVLRHNLYESFALVTQTANDLKNQGRLKEAREVCAHYLAECDNLRRERPAGYYAPVAELLLGDSGRNLDGKMAAEMERIDRVLGDIELAERSIREGRHAQANALLRSLIRDNFRIDFRRLIRLALWVRTSPTGAEVTMSWDGRQDVSLGRTTEEGILVRYPPHGTTVITIQKETFKPVTLTIRDFEDDQAAAPIIRLEKDFFWKAEGVGPQQARPLLLENSVLLAGRDGHVRTLDLQTGKPGMDHDHGLLSGFAAAPLRLGDVVWLPCLDQRILAFDLRTRRVLHNFEFGARLRTSPIKSAGNVVVVDELGMMRAFEGASESWSRQLNGRVLSDPVASDQAIYVATTSGKIYALTPQSGAISWSTNIGMPVHSPVILDPTGRPIVATDSGTVHLLDPGSGKELWSTRLDNAARGRPAIFDGHVWVCTLSGGIYALALGDGAITRRLSSRHGISIERGPVFDEDRFYIVDSHGKLASLDLDGTLFWRVDLETASATPPVIRGNRVFVATSEGAVYCFER